DPRGGERLPGARGHSDEGGLDEPGRRDHPVPCRARPLWDPLLPPLPSRRRAARLFRDPDEGRAGRGGEERRPAAAPRGALIPFPLLPSFLLQRPVALEPLPEVRLEAVPPRLVEMRPLERLGEAVDAADPLLGMRSVDVVL